MAGKTISAHTDEAVVRRLDQLTKLEGRTASQIAAAALGYYVLLPAEAHAALRHIQAFGSREDLERVSREIARRILDVDYEVVQRKIVEQMQVEEAGTLRTEEDLLDAGVRAANRATGAGRLASRAEAGDRASRRRPGRRQPSRS